jgi:uncharacterized protein
VTTDRNANVVFENRIDAPFWAGLADNEIRVQRCTGCGYWIWPAEWRCAACGSFELTWEAVEHTGVIYSWTRTHYPFVARYADLLPYVNVLVALPQAGGRRLVGLLIDGDDGLRIGAAVDAVIEAPSERTLNLHAIRWRLR